MLTSVSMRIQNKSWRVDKDGFLRVTAKVLKEGIFPYRTSELPADFSHKFISKPTVMERIPREAFTKDALSSLEGKPIVVDAHEWRDSRNSLKDGLTVGAVAGTPTSKDGEVFCDMLIQDADAIKAVQDEELAEVSAAYDSELEEANGEDGFDVVQGKIRFNHILLLPAGAGRCGRDVRILNSKEAEPMPVTVRVGNKDFEFADDKSAKSATEMCKMSTDGLQEQIGAKDGELKSKNDEISGHLAKLQEMQSALEEMKATLQSFVEEEEGEEYEGEEAEFKDSLDGGEKEKLTTAVGNCATVMERREKTVAHVLNSAGIDADEMDAAARDASWRLIVAQARRSNASRKTVTKVPAAGQKVANQGEKVHPVFAAR